MGEVGFSGTIGCKVQSKRMRQKTKRQLLSVDQSVCVCVFVMDNQQ